MDNETKQRIIEFNRRLGLKTEFIIAEEGVLGYAQNNTIYINESVEQDYERTNKHEGLHFFEDSPEFENLKKTVLSSVEKRLDQIRAEYELRYFGIYSEDEIKAGVLDNEIVIDLLVDNSIIEYENGLVIGDRLLGDIERGLEERRYLNMSIRRNVQNMNLSDWEKLFVENYYDGKEHVLPQTDKSRGIKREDAIRQDIENYLEQLYAMSEEEFVIDPHSPEVIREYESEIKALQARGEDTEYFEYDKEEVLEEIANRHSQQLYAEYKHIVDQIKGMEFEPSFKALMLRETLTKTYKLERDDDGRKTIVKKRDMHQSLAGHMVLNKETLSFIYKHPNSLQEYSNFANLYFAALEVYNKSTAVQSGISLEGVDTYEMGKWIKFEGKESNEEEYLKNAERLAALVKDTPWCTAQLASSQLADGDFFVFVDNEGNPHIAVKMEGNQIAEVRGIQNGNEQALEEEYRDVAISFLKNNKEIKYGIEWLESEEWNKRLVEYRRKIENDTFTVDDIPMLLEDLDCNGFREHDDINQNLVELKKIIMESEKMKDLMTKNKEVIIKHIEDESKSRHNLDNNYLLIKIINDPEYTKSCIERAQEFEFSTKQIIDLIKTINEQEYTNTCIERAQEFELSTEQIIDLIVNTNDQEYIKSWIERRNEININTEDLVTLITATGDTEYIKQCIESREKFGLDEYLVYLLISATEDTEYIKQCIEKREEFGLDANLVAGLIPRTHDIEYIRNCIDNTESYGTSDKYITKIVGRSNNSELIAEYIRKGKANYDAIYYVTDAKCIMEILQKEEFFKDYHVILEKIRYICKYYDNEVIKKVVENYKDSDIDESTILFIINSIEGLYGKKEYIKDCIERYRELGFNSNITTELIASINDEEYTKECIERRDELEIGNQAWKLIASTNDKEYIKQCIKRREEMELGIIDIKTLYRSNISLIALEETLSDIALETLDFNPTVTINNSHILSTIGEFLANGNLIDSIEMKIISSEDGNLHDCLLVINGEIAIGLDNDLEENSDGSFRIENHTSGYSSYIPEEFYRLREEALTKNPDTKIIVVGRSIIFNDGENETIYLIDEWNDCIVKADEIRTVDIIEPNREKNEHQIDEIAQFADSETSIDAERAIQETEREEEQSNKDGEEK